MKGKVRHWVSLSPHPVYNPLPAKILSGAGRQDSKYSRICDILSLSSLINMRKRPGSECWDTGSWNRSIWEVSCCWLVCFPIELKAAALGRDSTWPQPNCMLQLHEECREQSPQHGYPTPLCNQIINQMYKLTEQLISPKVSSAEFLDSIVSQVEHDELRQLAEELWICATEVVVSKI